MNQAVLELASEIYIGRSDWTLKSSGATTDMRRTLKTYDSKDNWVGRVIGFLCTPNPPDTIFQLDVSPGNCWPLQGDRGQVVILLPARVHLTAVSVQHIYKEVVSPGTVTSAPRDIAVFKTHRAFSHIKLTVESNGGNTAYTCIYLVQVHGKMAKPENLN
ncbi:SUN domain-containing protein 5-like isoform X3 [Neopsephotus bourkii]|uniref:SUN domain-containing protein 5-like isoform X3 n=1 Tax=Neopsephotus bourkii TaxID=309878 RepID=UPI002AA5C407|nr:SUN domain-containing protein 5-like isoform X3 [Neopsephotus bourkii]